MARANPHRPFVADPEQSPLWPDISGNDINGLGEEEQRPPRMIYWAPDPADIPHGELQRWFYTVDPGHPDFAKERLRRTAAIETPLPDVAQNRLDQPPQDWNAALAIFVESGVCDKIGVAEMRPDWVFEGHEIRQSRVIVIAVAHDFVPMQQAPAPVAGAEVMRQYTRAAIAAMDIAGWLRRQGWEAEPVTGPMTGALALIPPALAAGFGELGKHGSVINPEFGSSFRLSAVLTDAPFSPTPEQEHGIDDFCAACRICEDACPPEALSAQKQTVRGTLKWYVDFDKCLPFFNEHQGCAICIAVCPWSRPDVGVSLAAKLARRRERKP